MSERKYDLAVIGAGPGGYIAAIRAAQAGLKVVCIDKRAQPGGTCLNVGCIPSKCLLSSTEMLANLKMHGSEMGVDHTALTANFAQMMKRKNSVVKGLVEGVEGLFKHHQIEFIHGLAHFVDPYTLEVGENGHVETIKANFIIIATGSDSIPLMALPFDERQIISSTGALSLNQVPSRMAVIGGGVIGVELASVYQRLGSDVTIIEMLDHICPTLDQSISQSFLQILKKQGIKFSLSTQVVTAVKQPNEVILTLNHGEHVSNLSVDVVLVAIGRRPCGGDLNLDRIGVQVNSKGFIAVDSSFRVQPHPHIFAIGDMIEGAMLAHRASEEGAAVADFISGKTSTVNYMAIPNIIYTHPEVASVGLTEKEALESGIEVKKGTFAFKGNPRARCNGETEGFVKILGDAKSGQLIGLHIIGAHASELIAEGMMAIAKKATLDDIAHAPNGHPTMSEAIKEAAAIALGKPIHAV